MSRLTDLLRQVEGKDRQLAEDLRREFAQLSKRRAFGLNFERHVPETVELPGREIRKGDKVRFLAGRGMSAGTVDRRLWQVSEVRRESERSVAELVRRASAEAEIEKCSGAIDDLVVVAEFRDPIYPGLKSTGRVERGGEKPFHTVINSENYHALQALLYTHEGKVDAIYIDPPYNTGARDWKYNNDYVDGDDSYRHSKWLAMMERRLKLAKRLLNPEESVLIISIDEKEYLRLGLLLEQLYSGASIQMITSAINATGTIRVNEFTRVNEYLFFVLIGNSRITPETVSEANSEVPWNLLQRREMPSRRGGPKPGPDQFYPIYIDLKNGGIRTIGEPIPHGVPRSKAPSIEGCLALFPLKPDGTEMTWGLNPDSLKSLYEKGFVKITKNARRGSQGYSVYYLTRGKVRALEDGMAEIVGKNPDGSVQARYVDGQKAIPTTMWMRDSHNAQSHGTKLLSKFMPTRRFPFPKSLYAVEDALRLFIADKNKAVVVDFFSGSGTTCHAVMRLNKQDGGRRQCISVTNNEVSADEQKALRKKGFRPGDAEWEALGICEYITKPRIAAAITGRTPEGEPIKGDYKFTDEFPMADGFEENVEFFDLTYHAPRPVAHHREFAAIAPLLWLKAGAKGRRIDKPCDEFDVADTYGVLFDLDAVQRFAAAVKQAESVRMAFIITDDDRGFQSVCGELPARVEAVRLYESYLSNFVINAGRE